MAKTKPALYVFTLVILAGIFLLPDPFIGLRFPYSDGVLIFDGTTRVNFSTTEDAAIDDVDLILWQGETEAFQLLLTRNDGLGEVMVNGAVKREPEPGDPEETPQNLERFAFSSTPQMKIYLEHYVEIVKTSTDRAQLGAYPDALIPWPLGKFMEMGDAAFVTLYIDIATDQFVSPGNYAGEIVLNISGQATSILFKFTVVDIQITAEPLPVAIGVSDRHFSRFTQPIMSGPETGTTRGNIEDIYQAFAARLYDARAFPINFDTLIHPKVKHTSDGMDISFTRMDSAYLFFFGKTPVRQFPLNGHDIFGSSGVIRGDVLSAEWAVDAIDYTQRTAEHFRVNGWMDNAFCYIMDEPNTLEEYHLTVEIGQFVKELEPDLKYLVTEQPYHLPKQDGWPDLHGIVDIWCPQLGYYRTEECRAAQNEGQEVWIYPNQGDFTHFEPEILSPTLSIGDVFLAPQILVATIYRHEIDGLLYWDCVYWKHVDPFVNPNPSGDTDREFFGNGDGYLFYPGDMISKYYTDFDDIPGPIPSLRWMNLVQGLEDYRLLKHSGIDPEDIPSSRELLSTPSKYEEMILDLKRSLLP